MGGMAQNVREKFAGLMSNIQDFRGLWQNINPIFYSTDKLFVKKLTVGNVLIE